MVKQLMKDRRTFVRAKRILSIEYRLIKSRFKTVNKSWHLSTTQDMSLGGVAFYTDQDYRIGDILQIRVIMSGILDIFHGQVKIVRIDRRRSASHSLIAVQIIQKPTKRPAKRFPVPSIVSIHKRPASSHI